MASMKNRRVVLWPEMAVREMIAIADEIERPSLGDAIATAAWLGLRRLEWLTLPIGAFEQSSPPFDIAECGTPQELSWALLAPLRKRIDMAKSRRLIAQSKYSTFFLNDDGLPWTVRRLHDAFELVRGLLAARHESFPTEYAVNYYANDPHRVPMAWLTMRLFRQCCIVTLTRAGFERKPIQALTGHSMADIELVLGTYKEQRLAAFPKMSSAKQRSGS
jgi:hypothetical protein